jgi:hypothetical protein
VISFIAVEDTRKAFVKFMGVSCRIQINLFKVQQLKEPRKTFGVDHRGQVAEGFSGGVCDSFELC